MELYDSLDSSEAVVVEDSAAVAALVRLAWQVSRSDVRVAIFPSSSAIFVSFSLTAAP